MPLFSLNDLTNSKSAKATPMWSGRHSSVLFFIDGSKVPLLVESWSCSPDMTEGKDHVNGEPKARPWRVVDGYELKLTCKMRDTSAIEDALADVLVDEDDEASSVSGQSSSKQVAIAIKTLDGSRRAFTTGGIVTIGKWDWNVGGNTSRASVTIPIHAQDFKQVPV